MRCSLLDNGVFFYPERNNLSVDKPCCMFAPGKKKAYPLRKIEFKDRTPGIVIISGCPSNKECRYKDPED